MYGPAVSSEREASEPAPSAIARQWPTCAEPVEASRGRQTFSELTSVRSEKVPFTTTAC